MSADPSSRVRLTSISTLAMRLGVTVRNLRYFEDIGLVRSEKLGASARGFDPAMVERLTLIVGLRALGVSTQVIGRVLNDQVLKRSPELVRAQLLQALDGKRALMAALQSYIDLAPSDPVAAPRDSALSALEAAVVASPSKVREAA
jgi:DNA-binding transcriptional MerR regulator